MTRLLRSFILRLNVVILYSQLKEEVAKVYETTVDRVCLIFAGKILKDGESLLKNGVKDGLAVHLVIKSGNRVSTYLFHFN